MALRPLPRRLPEGDPRREGHETTYQPSRGGYFPPPKKPVPGAPKKKGEGQE